MLRKNAKNSNEVRLKLQRSTDACVTWVLSVSMNLNIVEMS